MTKENIKKYIELYEEFEDACKKYCAIMSRYKYEFGHLTVFVPYDDYVFASGSSTYCNEVFHFNEFIPTNDLTLPIDVLEEKIKKQIEDERKKAAELEKEAKIKKEKEEEEKERREYERLSKKYGKQ